MKQQSITGSPRACLNRNCKDKFTKDSHLGYLMHSEMNVYAVMRCLKCCDTFLVCQHVSQAYEYYDRLPKDKKSLVDSQKPITISEMKKVRKHLESAINPLDMMKIMHPGKPDDE